jgi:putative ABC transport system permease protein
VGIRLALGADRGAILGMVVRNGTLLACAGAVLGLAASLLLTQLMASLLFDVQPRDPLTFLCVPIALIVVAIFASYIPARRAAKVDPMVALRYE